MEKECEQEYKYHFDSVWSEVQSAARRQNELRAQSEAIRAVQAEQERDREKERADSEKERADKEKKRAQTAESKIKSLEKELNEYKIKEWFMRNWIFVVIVLIVLFVVICILVKINKCIQCKTKINNHNGYGIPSSNAPIILKVQNAQNHDKK